MRSLVSSLMTVAPFARAQSSAVASSRLPSPCPRCDARRYMRFSSSLFPPRSRRAIEPTTAPSRIATHNAVYTASGSARSGSICGSGSNPNSRSVSATRVRKPSACPPSKRVIVGSSLGSAAHGNQIFVHLAIAVYRSSDVAWRDSVGTVGDEARDLPRGEEVGHDLAFVTLAHHRIVDRVPALVQHPLDEVVELGKDVDRRILQLFLERGPLALPLVTAQPRLLHALLVRRRPGFQTRQ